MMEITVWIAEDQSGDLFFDGDEWAKKLTQERVIMPLHRGLVEESCWQTFEAEWERTQRPFAEREGRDYEPPTFYGRRFVRTQIAVELQTAEDFPMWACLDPDVELPRLARWKALAALSLDRVLPCPVCHEGRLASDGERLRCLRCEHGPSDWQRRPG